MPAQGAVVPDFSGPVRFRFDETLSERGPRGEDAVAVSPEDTAGINVDRSSKEVKVTLKGGWQKGRIYHVTLFPGYMDRAGNARTASYELVFSTGPQILPTALAGLVSDRLTGRPVVNARVTAVSASDSVPYTALSDTAGFFALRGMPISSYRVTAYVDVNRNRKMDTLEPTDVKFATIVTNHDTTAVEFSVLARDTTPARLLKAEARDSLQVRLTFDDFIEASEPLGNVVVIGWQLPDSTTLPPGRLMHVRDYERFQRSIDTTTARAPRPAAAAAAAAVADTAKAYPTQDLVWIPSRALPAGKKFRISVSRVRNIGGLPDGGGSVTFETAPPFKAPTKAPAPPPKDTIKK